MSVSGNLSSPFVAYMVCCGSNSYMKIAWFTKKMLVWELVYQLYTLPYGSTYVKWKEMWNGRKKALGHFHTK